MTNNIAAIDLGSNSCRLVIADPQKKLLYTNSVSTKLSQGMGQDKLLTDEAQERTIKALCQYAKVMKEHNVTKYRAITTAAVRQSQNGVEFVRMAKEKSGISLEIVDEYEEARLNLVGAMAHSYGKSDYVCVFDIGGASTEVSIATNERNPKIIQTTSIPLGCRNSSEKYGLSEYDATKAQQLSSDAIEYIKDFNIPQNCDVIATSSIPLRLAAIYHNHKKYIRQDCDGIVLSADQINNTTQKIYNMSQEDMAQNPNIGENRSYIFVAGIVLLQTIVKKLNITELTASLLSAKDAIIEELSNE